LLPHAPAQFMFTVPLTVNVFTFVADAFAVFAARKFMTTLSPFWNALIPAVKVIAF